MKNSGFTLIELIIVLVIVGILSVAASEKIFTSGYKDEADVLKFITTARFAQHKSMVSGGHYSIKLNSSKSYSVTDGSQKITVPGENTQDISVDKAISAKTSTNKTVNAITFDYLGEPMDNNTLFQKIITITIDDKKVIITPFAGGIYGE